MVRRALPLLALLALFVGVGSAGARTQATTTVVVEVFGQGKVTSNAPNTGINCGNGASACYLTFTSGGTIVLPEKPANGWTFVGWSGDCVVDSSGNCTIDASTTANDVVDATFASTGAGTTQSTLSVTYDTTNGFGYVTAPEQSRPGSAIDCGNDGTTTTSSCSWTVLTGSTLTLFETPATGYAFSGWGGACSGGGACTVQLKSNASVTAAWVGASATHALTVGVSGNGSVSGGGISCPSTCTASEPLNSGVTLTASPASGYTFTGWGGDCSGTGSCTLTMSADHSVTASFAQAVTLSVDVSGAGNVSGGSGAINCGSGASVCSAPFAANATVTLVATPQTGASFLGWTGACGGSATTCTVSMSSSRSVSAKFSAGTTLTVTANGPGTVSGGGITCGSHGSTCTAAETANAQVTLTATPDSGASFSSWGGACSGASTTCTVTMSAAQNVSASFSSGGGGSGSHVSVTVSGSGTVIGDGIDCGKGGTVCTVSLAAGTSVTLSEQPSAGSSFAGWGGACSGTAPSCAFTVAAAGTAVSARFTPAPPGTLTLIVAGHGSISSSAGSCVSTGPSKTCVEHLRAKSKVTLHATAGGGSRFAGWGGACVARRTAATCTVTLSVARSVSARFSGGSSVGGAAVASLGHALVSRRGGEYSVTLRFHTTVSGIARVQGLRAGRVSAALSLRVAAGNATIRVPVVRSGAYVFELRLAGRVVSWNACLGRCGNAVKSPPFAVTREAPKIVRAGDGWSLTLRLRSNLIAADRVRVRRRGRSLVDIRFLGRPGQNSVSPFLLGPGDYTLTVTATDVYGRVRTLTWIIALA